MIGASKQADGLRKPSEHLYAHLAMLKSLHALTFASDAKLFTLIGVSFLALAGTALLMESRRAKRAQIERVGWVPWTGVFLCCAVIGGGILAMSLPAMLGSG